MEPIAIVGQACTLPEALTPAELWANVIGARDCLSHTPAGRWDVTRAAVMGTVDDAADRTWTDVGGYVSGFEAAFDPAGFLVSPEDILGLDPQFQWVLHGVREALRGAGLDAPSPRAGLVLGGLSFPTSAMARYAESVWLGSQGPDFAGGRAAERAGVVRPHARNRFASGLPAHFTARALGLGAGAFALDAACASSLYAIKLACDRLHDGSADVMVAGAVSRTDDLFIHVGFCALAAMSLSGRSRPFHRDADGLVPAEGAGFVVLQRLRDAVAAGRRILGVIRAVGLSNDGRGRGLLAPSEEGQERAMRLAYAAAGVTPRDIGLLECHATGTPVGDVAETRSTARVFEGCDDVPIGSLKSNLGHLVPAAGVAGLIKVLAALESGRRPPTLYADEPIEALASTPFRLLREAEDWTGPRRAAISAFGFGGNNAHLIVEAWEGRSPVFAATPREPEEVAIVGIGARVGDGESVHDFTRALFEGTAHPAPRATVAVALDGLRFPPRDLAQALGQQTLILEAAREAAEGLDLPRERTAVLIGMGCDPELARYGARWKVRDWAERWARDVAGCVDFAWLARARDEFQNTLEAAGALGAMPNIPANRINSQLDVAGPGFTVAAEEASGIVALELAARALREGEIDAAVVGAVDLSHETVHCTALEELGRPSPPGDAAVVLVLKRLADARRDGNEVYAVLGGNADPALLLGDAETGGLDLGEPFGKAHAAHGLLHVAAGALALRYRARLRKGAPSTPWIGGRAAQAVRASVSVLEAPAASVSLHPGSTAPWQPDAPPRLSVFSGADRAGVLAALAAGRESDEGPARLVITASDPAERAARGEQARRWLAQGGPPPEGVAFRETPIGGELAFVFTGAAAAYSGMGRDLALALPELVDALGSRCAALAASTAWLYGPGDGTPTHPLDQLWGTSFVCQLHAELSREVLGLTPDATIGYSSGESNALFATGAWSDVDAMVADTHGGTLFTRDLVGEFAAPRRAWARLGEAGTTWASYSVAAPVEQVRAALADEPLAHLTIVNTPDECVIGGEAAACARVVARLGSERALPLGYDMAAHCPEIEEVREAWWQLHRRETRDVPAVRFYTNATGASFRPTPEAAADAITGQALGTLDFPRVIEQAYADGVRVFVEHGPRGLCTGWIRRILAGRDHVAVPLDVSGRSGVRQVMNAAAWLVAAGVKVNARALEERLAQGAPPARPGGSFLKLPAHPKPPHLPSFEARAQEMERAPALPPVVAMPPAAVTAVPAAVAVSRVSSGTAEVIARMAAHQEQLGALHRTFLAQQAAVHQSFLALRQTAEATLLQAYGAALRGGGGAPPAGAAVQRAPLRAVPPPAAPPGLPGPKFDRAQLEVLAGGRISAVFGSLFAAQDGYHRQVRMPEPPLLLADRVTGIDAVAGSMGLGTLWTETDVRADSWYIDAVGRMPPGIMIEAGQADLLLISWLGVDLLNRGERVYRLLGCELTFHGTLGVPGETLVFDIHVDSHAQQGDVRLFFFHYNCHVNGERRLTVRHAQAGFFTDEELRNSGGVLWDCADEPYSGDGPLDPPAVACASRAFGRAAVRSFAEGRVFDCFGPGWEVTQAHVRTPRIGSGRMLFLDEVTDFDPRGGPWGRGYLRAETPVTSGDWFFEGHFKNDPCMPGTLMFEGCLQAMAFYLAALGFTVGRDGWAFEPVPDQKYLMRCRGQVTPASRHLVYEVFVSEVSAAPLPTVFADLLCTVDGLKVFHARRVGLRLAPDWPLEHWKSLAPAATQLTGEPVPLQTLGGLREFTDPKPPAAVDGFAFGFASLLACAWGRPATAFGPSYAAFDGPRRLPRLPGPPYHFVSRVMKVDGPMGGMKAASTVEVEYDVPAAQWYFEQNGNPTMPCCVILEAALQPCGWIAMYAGSALTSQGDLLFRNLDGTGTLHEELLPASGTLRTRVTLETVSQTPEMIIESFTVECSLGERRVYDMKAVFGFFPPEAFENQVGLSASAEERARLAAPSNCSVSFVDRPPRYFGGELQLPGPMLLMLDRVTGFWPEGGRAGLGYLRAEKDVRPEEWFFKAHFFQDPVQPGSLGIEAMCQLLQFYMIERGLDAGVSSPRFEPIRVGKAVSWTFRGQIVPANRKITVEMEIIETGADERGAFAVAEAWLWVDGKRIYHAKNLGMRIVAGAKASQARPAHRSEPVLDPATDPWLEDHCPTWTLPVLPMMSMVDRIAEAAAEQAGRPVAALENVQLHRWLPFPGGPVRLRTDVAGEGDTRSVTLLAWRDAADPKLSRFEPVATGVAHLGPPPAAPPPFAPLADLVPVADPYVSGGMFHGPAFQYLTELRMGSTGSSAVLRAERGSVPRGHLHQGLLDGVTHAIPHDALWQWSSEIPRDLAAYPHRIPEMHLHEPLPDSGEVRVEVRFAGFEGDPRFPGFDIQILSGDRVIVSFRLVGVLLPKGPIGMAPPEARLAFLRDRRYVPGVALSEFDGTTTRLSGAVIQQSDWLPGNVARIYAVPPARRGEVVAEVAVREHVARRAFVHPSSITVEEGFTAARAAMRPLRRHAVQLSRSGDAVEVVDAGPPAQDLAPVRRYWSERIGIGPWPVEDLYYGLIARFVGDVVIADPEAFERVRGRSCLYLANHQVGIESLLFSVLLSALSDTPAVTLAKAEHRTSWLGWLIAHSFSYPGVTDPNLITFFEREDRESLLKIVNEIGAEMRTGKKSAMVHVEGTRSLACRRPVLKMSSAFLDMALAVGAPIIPVRFVGGLPVEEAPVRLEFPLGFGRQDYWIGRPILPEELAALPYKDRKAVVISAINGLGPDLAEEVPSPPDPGFGAAVEAWIARTGATPEDAVFFATLATLADPGDEVRALCEGARNGRLAVGSDPRGQWLARLAERLFGPRGPEIQG